MKEVVKPWKEDHICVDNLSDQVSQSIDIHFIQAYVFFRTTTHILMKFFLVSQDDRLCDFSAHHSYGNLLILNLLLPLIMYMDISEKVLFGL